MHSRIRIATLAVLLLFVSIAAAVFAQRGGAPAASPASTGDATSQIVAKAQAFLAALDAAQRPKAQFAFDAPQKTNWSNLPSPMYQRHSLRIGDLTPSQRAALMSLLSTALSPDGYRKVTEIMRGDEVLRTNQAGRGGPAFGEDEYYIAFLGTPSTTTPWMLQFGGHHLAINLTLAGTQATMAPSLPAAQPARYTFEGRTIRPLGNEHDKGFAFVNALSDEQRSRAILNYRVADLVLGPTQDGKTIQPEGLTAMALSQPQQTMLLDLVREWTGIVTDSFAEARMTEVRANLPQTYFAWSGPTTNGSPAYFRIQGPTLVIEYAPQQGSVDHIHTIYRDPTNDYGATIARR
ncbi:MAG: DUF3500 domain-containing protein [Vicinamibacterales bacterium]|nr:DUF3500 domain-containing protein [Vicinamibacterales bacterium]